MINNNHKTRCFSGDQIAVKIIALHHAQVMITITYCEKL